MKIDSSVSGFSCDGEKYILVPGRVSKWVAMGGHPVEVLNLLVDGFFNALVG